MDPEYDAVVVGVGGMGSAATYHLARRGLDVLGIERYDVPHAHGSSHGSTRLIRLAQYEDPAYVPLVRAAVDNWRALEAVTGDDLFHAVGSVDVGPPESNVVTGSIRSCEDHGLSHDVLSGAALNDRVPGYGVPEDYRAVYQPDGGFLHVEGCTVAHVEAAHAEGATVRAREAVTGWSADESGVRVETDRDSYTADRLVVTAGAWTGRLVPALAPYLEPVREVLAWFQPQEPDAFAPENFPVFVTETPTGQYYGTPVYGRPGIKVGGANGDRKTGAPEDLTAEPTREEETFLRRFVRANFPDGAGPTVGLTACMYTNSPDEEFVVDRHPDHHNVVVGAGFSGHGYKFTSVVGEVLADLAVDGTTEHPVEGFAVSRFE